MPNWTNLTLAELRAASKADIIRDVAQYIAEHFTKREIIAWLIDRDTVPDKVRITRDDQGRIVERVEVERDPETGAMVSGRAIRKTYYPSGEIKNIRISNRDADNNEVSWRVIEHFTNGQPPRSTWGEV